jgi:stress-induced morphogen
MFRSPAAPGHGFGGLPPDCAEIESCGILPWTDPEEAMITVETLTAYIRRHLPDAQVSVTDRTGTMDHLAVMVISGGFQGKPLLDRHRIIYQALAEPMKDGRIHALEIKAETPEGG